MDERLCLKCGEPLEPDAHGNQKMHPHCAYGQKKELQKKKYKIGNQTKLSIQKNEAIAERLCKIDIGKQGIPYLKVMEEGFRFGARTQKLNHSQRIIHLIEEYGYEFVESLNGTLIVFYHESEL